MWIVHSALWWTGVSAKVHPHLSSYISGICSRCAKTLTRRKCLPITTEFNFNLDIRTETIPQMCYKQDLQVAWRFNHFMAYSFQNSDTSRNPLGDIANRNISQQTSNVNQNSTTPSTNTASAPALVWMLSTPASSRHRPDYSAVYAKLCIFTFLFITITLYSAWVLHTVLKNGLKRKCSF